MLPYYGNIYYIFPVAAIHFMLFLLLKINRLNIESFLADSPGVQKTFYLLANSSEKLIMLSRTSLLSE